MSGFVVLDEGTSSAKVGDDTGLPAAHRRDVGEMNDTDKET